MDQEQILKLMKDFLQENFQMVIATLGDHPWIATVYYSLDEDMNIYFLSDPKTIHCRQIAENPDVAVSVAASPQNPSVKKKGIQIFGLAEQISGVHKIKHAVALWKKTLGVTSDDYSYEGMMNRAIKGRMYKVTPIKIKFFNEEIWKEGEEPLIEL